MCDGMFTNHVNAIINMCADLKESCVCNHINLFYTMLTIKRRLFKKNKILELKKVTQQEDTFCQLQSENLSRTYASKL